MDTKRIIRDIEDGIMGIDNSGTILGMNPSALRLLGLDSQYIGEKYAKIQFDNPTPENDDFHEMLLDAIRDKEKVHRRKVNYKRANGDACTLMATSSVLFDDDNKQQGVILSFEDCTREEKLTQKLQDSSIVYVVILCSVCIWVLLTAMWDHFGQPISATNLSKLMVLVAFIPAWIIFTRSTLTLEDVGLSYHGKERAILMDLVYSIIGVILLVLIKLFMLKVDPGFFGAGDSFVDWGKYPPIQYVLYVFSVVGQEFSARGIAHGSLRMILQGKNSDLKAIAISSLMFGALHIHVGFIYMISAMILLGLLGFVYNRQNSIWGLCIPHYVLGMALGLLGFVG